MGGVYGVTGSQNWKEVESSLEAAVEVAEGFFDVAHVDLVVPRALRHGLVLVRIRGERGGNGRRRFEASTLGRGQLGLGELQETLALLESEKERACEVKIDAQPGRRP